MLKQLLEARVSWIAYSLGLAVFAVGGVSLAQGNGMSPDAPGEIVERHQIGTAGMIIHLDPEGGMRAPTQAEAEALLGPAPTNLERSDWGLTVEYRADGTGIVDLDGRYQNYSVARLRTDGSVEVGCTHSQADADHWCEQEPTPAAEPLPEE